MALYEGFIIFAIRKLFQDLTDKFFFIAKKIIETMSSSKFSNVEVSKENVSRPKRAKRKLYTNEISSPIDISGQVILMDRRVKESDHQILKRRLRTRTVK